MKIKGIKKALAIRWNKFTSTSLFKFLLIATLLIVAGPIFNIVLKTSVGTEVAGDANAWIGYFGNLLGTSAAIVALSFTLWQNNKNHQELKTLQINSISFNDKKERLYKISEELLNLYSTISSEKLRKYIKISITFNQSHEARAFYLNIIEDIWDYEKKLRFMTECNSDIIDLKGIKILFNECKIDYLTLLKDMREEHKLNNKIEQKTLERIEQIEKQFNYTELYNLIISRIKEAQEKLTADLIE